MEIRGDELVEALLHVQTCDECYRRLPKLNSEDLFTKLFGEDEDDTEIEDGFEIEEPDQKELVGNKKSNS